MMRGTEAILTRLAPDVVAPWARMVSAVAAGPSGAWTATLREVCAEANGLQPLPTPPGDRAPLPLEVREFAEQFCVDVSGLTPALRASLDAALVSDSPTNAVTAIWTADMLPRVDHVLGRLFPDEAGPHPAEQPWNVVDKLIVGLTGAFVPAVARLRALDPVTTEVVRLRGAAAHDCRLCKSLRDTDAAEGGGEAELFDRLAADPRIEVELEDRHRAALALADAMIWSPAHLSEQVIDDVRRHFSAAEQVEIVLDVVRNSVNKIMVARGKDAAHVTDGVEFYRVGSDGMAIFNR